MGRNNLIAWMLSVCFVALIPSVGATQTDKRQDGYVRFASGDCEARRTKVQGADLYFGNSKVSSDLLMPL